MYASEGGDVTFAIYGKYDRTWLNSSGLESRTEIQLGGESLVSTSLMQPLDTAHRWFVEPRVFWSRSLEDVFRDGERLARYQFQDTAAQLDFGVNIADVAQARLGYLYDRRSVDVDIGLQLLPEIDAKDAGITALFEYDTRDTAFSPTRGLAVAAEYMRSDDSLGADRDWERAELGVGVALPLRRDVLWLSLAGGSDLGSELPADRKFPLGGPGSFPGLELGELRVGNYWTASTGYLWKFKDIATLRNQAWYLGLQLMAGGVSDRVDNVSGADMYGGALYLNGRTAVGPLTVGVGATSEDSWSLWVAGRAAGRPWHDPGKGHLPLGLRSLSLARAVHTFCGGLTRRHRSNSARARVVSRAARAGACSRARRFSSDVRSIRQHPNRGRRAPPPCLRRSYRHAPPGNRKPATVHARTGPAPRALRARPGSSP
jgi:hypothetical protein